MAPPRASAGGEPSRPGAGPPVGEGASRAPASSSDAGGEAGATPSVVVVTTETIVVAGASRAFVLAAPRDGARSLVLALHGDGGDGASFRAELPFDVATASGAAVAYPTGTGRSWDL